MAHIYKITNTITGKAYIGKTEVGVEKRWQQHCRDCNKRRNEKRPLYAAMNKYGIECFTVEEIEETNNPEEREMFWIDYYGTFGNGYNATIGGDGKAYIDKERILQLWYEGKTPKEIYQTIGCCQESVLDCLRGHGIPSGEVRTRAQSKIPVAQVDLATGEVLRIFPSSVEAGRFIGKATGAGHIRHVCYGERKSAYGYGWKYV